MKKLLIVVMACYALNARSQVDGSRNFLYLYSDTVIYAKRITLRPDFVGSWQLRADSRRIPSKGVKFFNNKDGFFANTRGFTLDGTTGFSERIVEGRINLYQQAIYDPILYDRGYRYRGRPVANLRMFYNKGFDDLKKVNYRNLKNDMADNPESMDLLEGYRNAANTSKLMYTAAGASILAGMISFLVSAGGHGSLPQSNSFHGNQSGFSSTHASFKPGLLLFGLGTGLAVGGFAIQMSGARKLESAIDVYNR